MGGILRGEKGLTSGKWRAELGPREPFARAQHAIWLPQPLALGDEKFARIGGVEGEHLVVAWHHAPRADGVRELRRLAAVEVSGHAALEVVPIDREQREVDGAKARSFSTSPS